MTTSLSGQPHSHEILKNQPTVVLHYYPDFGAMGGIERYISTVSQQLQTDEAIQIHVVCSAGTPLYHQLQLQGIPVTGIKTLPAFASPSLRMFDVFSMLQLWKVIRRVQPGLVHLHIGHWENLIFKLMGLPTIFTAHGYGTLYRISHVPSSLKYAVKHILRSFFKAFAALNEKILFVSRAEKDAFFLEGYLPTTVKTQVLHNGLPVQAVQERYATFDRAQFLGANALDADAPVIAFVNRLDDNKNPLAFIRLAEKLADMLENKAPQFLILGDGPMKTVVSETVARSPIANQFKLLGHQENVYDWIKSADLIVNTPLREGFGLGVLEAMMLGTPCVSYNAGGISELLSTPGLELLRVEVGDEAGLFAAVSTVLSASTLEKHVLTRVLQNAAQAYDLAQHIHALKQVYLEAAKPKSVVELKPLVSVIVPVYNGERDIETAVASILNQSYSNLEVIVVNDGSTDNTLDRLAGIHDARLQVYTQQNVGVAIARNFGMAKANGEYFAFLDSDDEWLPSRLAEDITVLNSVSNPRCIVYNSYVAVDIDKNIVNHPPLHQFSGDLSARVLTTESLFLPSTCMIHRDIAETVGGFAPEAYHEDHVFFVRACQQFPAYPTEKRAVLYRQTTAGRCRSVLENYDSALAAELSIQETLRPYLNASKLTTLRRCLVRNLFYRFMMYDRMDHAKTLWPQLDKRVLFGDRKGLLCLLSMGLNFNLLCKARIYLQAVLKKRGLETGTVESEVLVSTPSGKTAVKSL